MLGNQRRRDEMFLQQQERLYLRQKSAVKIQALQRGKVGRTKSAHITQSLCSAKTLQRTYRGHLGRQQARRTLPERLERQKRRAAAIKIQALHRGQAYRAKVERDETNRLAATKIQTVYRGRLAKKKVNYIICNNTLEVTASGV